MTNIAQILPWIQIGLSIFMAVLILLQRSDASLGSAFGGSDGGSMYTRRGAEKILFNLTIVVSILFVLSSIAALIVAK